MGLNSIIAAVLLLLFFSTPGKTLVKTVVFYLIVMFPNRQWHMPNWLLPEIIHNEKSIEADGRQLTLELYHMKRSKNLPTVIAYVPLAPEGKHDPAVVNLLRGLARIGYFVVLPHWPNRPIGLIDPQDAKELTTTLEYLATLPQVDPKRIGVVSVSYGTGPTLDVATSDRLGPKLQYVTSIGGYQDLWPVVQYCSTERFRAGKSTVSIRPHPYLRYVFLRAMSQWAGNEADRKLLRQLLDIPHPEQGAKEMNLILTRKKLSPQSRELFDVIVGDSPLDSMDELQRALPKQFHDVIEKLSISPKRKLRIRSKMMIIHSKSDRLIPYPEAERMAAWASKQVPTTLSLIQGFDHTLPPEANPVNLITVYLPNASTILRFLHEFVGLQYAPEPARALEE